MYTKKLWMVLLLVVLISLPVFAEYNSQHVKNIMQNNVTQLGMAAKALKDGDFLVVGRALMSLARGMLEIKVYQPPRGSKSDWDYTMDAIVMAAFRGIGAAGNEDPGCVRDALAELKKLNGRGHRAHK